MYLGGNRRWVPLLFIILARNIDCKSILQKPLKQFGQVASKYKRKSRYKSRAIFSAFLFTPCTGIRNPGSGKFLLVESGIGEIFACGIRNAAQGIQDPTTDWNPSSTDKDWNPVPGIHNPRRGILISRLS